ncbi:Putative acyl-CoA ligase [Nocardia cyriacigeorgica GUH-2]|uniref:Putative acyl-CoA ligase n=1 Tax=Nocardia cyriacigeorgica (strain GUH-2) TaxID=1127134 RepID=H6RBE6_NOCCG|nr:Putative acyl-CoA ligase [Nocardia cyriacigeorgica GUH-2]
MTNVAPIQSERSSVLARLAEDPPIGTLTGLLAEQARRRPGHEFLRFADRSWTFAEIDEWTTRLARRLIAEDGVWPGDRVAIMLPNVVQWPVAWLAVLKAGAVTVPVNSSYQRADLEFVLRDSGARVLVTDAEHAPLAEQVRAENSELAGIRIIHAGTPGDLTAYPADPPAVDIAGETLANLQYTSGTTGFPKACMLTHDYWTRLGWVCANAAGLGADDVALTSQPFSYMDPQWNTALCLTIGAPLVVLPRFSASGFMADVRKHRATFCYVLGSMPTLLFKQPPHPAGPRQRPAHRAVLGHPRRAARRVRTAMERTVAGDLRDDRDRSRPGEPAGSHRGRRQRTAGPAGADQAGPGGRCPGSPGRRRRIR